MKRTLLGVLEGVYAYPLGTVIVCFVLSVAALRLYTVPWSSIIGCVFSATLAGAYSQQCSLARRTVHYVAPVVLCLISVCMNPYVASTLVAGWLCLLNASSGHKNAWVLRHFAYAILMFEVVELLLLKHHMVHLWLTDLVHMYSQLIRESHGGGGIVGPLQIDYRLLVFTIVATMPLTYRVGHHLLLLVCQTLVVIAVIPLRVYSSPAVATAIVSVSACVLVSLIWDRGGHETAVIPKWRKRALQTVQLTGLAYLFLLVVLGGVEYPSAAGLSAATKGIWWFGQEIRARCANFDCLQYSVRQDQHATSSGEIETADAWRRSILFVNGNSGQEGDESDMTHFASPGDVATASAFDKGRNNPRYDKLVNQLLPALGYRVSVETIEDIRPEEYARHGLVVLICIQKKLPPDHKQALYECVESGTTNVLIAGDHTDIRGVREPFNDFMAPLGVELNYDSVYPFGSWDSQIVYSQHPVNGLLTLASMGTGGDPGVSVGASLTLDKALAWPVLEAGDGFADQGTPNAPMFAGLGDQRYTENEVRGGLILAAERPLGKGTVMAFGDTAFLQNSSISRNFAYVASVFAYLTRPSVLLNGAHFKKLGLVCGVIIVVGLMYRFSGRYAVICILLLVAAIPLTSTLKSDYQTINALNADVLLIDDSHGEAFQSHDQEKGIHTLTDLLDRKVPFLTLVSNAFDAIDTGRVRWVLLLAPRGSLGSTEQDRLHAFVSNGGRLVYASGYYEATKHSQWLARFGCRVTPFVLGAGQQVSLADDRFKRVPNITETWGLDLSSGWSEILTCYGKPVVAFREYGQGRVCVMSDSFALLDGTMGNGATSTDADNYTFVSTLLEALKGKRGGSRVERGQTVSERRER